MTGLGLIAWTGYIDYAADENVETYPYGKDRIIAWSENFGYVIWTLQGTQVYAGTLDQTLRPGAVPLNILNCNWFAPKDANTMLYLAFGESEGKADIRVWDFDTKTSEVWALGLEVDPSQIHAFCWLHWNPGKKIVQLGWQEAQEGCRYMRVVYGQEGGFGVPVGVQWPNTFFCEKDTLYFAANPESSDQYRIAVLDPHGLNLVNFQFGEDSNFTVMDFGFLADNTFYLIVIEFPESDCDIPPTVGALILDTGVFYLETTTEIRRSDLEWVLMDSAPTEEESYLPDCYWILDKSSQSLHSICAECRLVGWDFTKTNGQWACSKRAKPLPASKLQNYCGAWDRANLWCYTQGTTNNINFTIHIL
jgi:hypothetical protein